MLEVRGIEFGYRNGRVLNGLSLEAGAGEIVGILGPNGAGKTTLFRIITGVLRPSRGDVLVNGTSLFEMKMNRRARMVAAVPQNAHLPTGFTVLDVVMMGRNPHLGLLQWEGRHDLEVAAEAMLQTDTTHLAHRSVTELSGGEQQRVVLATALAQEASVLLLDEPTSNLDLAQQAKSLSLVREVCRATQGAVLVSMHDLTLAAQYCDRLVLLKEGRAWAEGTPQEVLTPENIEAAYGVRAAVFLNPITGVPMVSLSSPTEVAASRD